MEVVTDAVVPGVVVVGVVLESGVWVAVASEGVVSIWVEAVVVPVGELPQATVKRRVARSATSSKSDVFFISVLSLVRFVKISENITVFILPYGDFFVNRKWFFFLQETYRTSRNLCGM